MPETTPAAVVMTEAEWGAEGTRLFGSDLMEWRFICPSCGHIAAAKDWKAAGAPHTAVAFSCVGRWLPNPTKIFKRPGPCNYAGGGLFGLNPITVVAETGKHQVFAFAAG